MADLSSEINSLLSDPVGYAASSLQFLANLLGMDLYTTLLLVLAAILFVGFFYLLLRRLLGGKAQPEVKARISPALKEKPSYIDPLAMAASAPKPAAAPVIPERKPSPPTPAAKEIELEANAITIEPRGDKFIIRLGAPRVEKVEVPKVVEKVVEVPKVVEKIVEVPKVVERAAPAKPRAPSVKAIDVTSAKDIDEAMVLVQEKYGISAITLANTEGLVISSTCSSPEEDAAHAAFLYDSISVGKYRLSEGLRYVEIAGKEMKYLLIAPYDDSKIIALARSENKLDSDALEMLAEDLKASLNIIFP